MKILILDSSYLIYKSYFGMKNKHLKVERDGEEINTSAIFGFLRETLNLITEERYNFIISVNDTPPYYKKKLYRDYKKRPDKGLVIPSFHDERELIQAILYDLGIPTFFCNGYEGEEIAHTLIKRLSNHKVDLYTSDEDCYALLYDHVQLIKTNKGDIIKFGLDDLQEKYHVDRKQFTIFKALTGCKSDNIPSINGVGPVTASKLINEHGSMKNIIKHVDDITQEKLRKNFKKAIKSGLLNRAMKLTKIEVPQKLNKYEAKETLTYKDILEWIDAQSFLGGTNKLLLRNLQRTQKKNLKNIMEEIC